MENKQVPSESFGYLKVWILYYKIEQKNLYRRENVQEKEGNQQDVNQKEGKENKLYGEGFEDIEKNPVVYHNI